MARGAGRSRPKVIVIGNGMVGHKVAESLVKKGVTRTRDVVVVGEEPERAYDRVHLSTVFQGSRPEDLYLADPILDGDPAVSWILGQSVVCLDRESHTVSTSAGQVIPFDTAVLATGSVPFVPPVPGHDTPGCFTYRTLADTDAIRRWAAGRDHAVVVGGGLLGLEAASALRSCGLATEVIEVAPWLMPAQVDQVGGELLAERVRQLGLAVHTATTLVSVEAGSDGAVAAVHLAPPDEPEAPERLATDMVVFAAGVRPRDELARSCGLEVGPRGGIVVDSRCRTADPTVFAVGECALIDGRLYGLVAPGYQMARVAAETICGGEEVFDGHFVSTSLKLLGVPVASFGDALSLTPGSTTVSFTDRTTLVHKRLVTGPDGKLIGGVLVGDTTGFELMSAVAAGQAEPPEDLPGLLLGSTAERAHERGGTGPVLPDTATVCSCENVSKGKICSAVASLIDTTGGADVSAVKGATGAGTGCGGCVPQISALVKAVLAERGVRTSSRLCEHFAYSRQELYDLVRLGRASSFAELISTYGQGGGCEVCKPAVASILASVKGGHVLDGEGASLQDTNDHALANLQRDGTYSVVPRVPGGEITPDRLLVLGEVARDFGLYVKITGGQRIDLLGARLEQLPAIWARLVDAGFESGHAYGKAVRTVKSCVGSTWCRFGVQDSTSLAIDLELRYRGLRSPHKIKMGVSGCVRECAEARSKDVGVIATERGWNLYVCGNGGASPRHADLLASDLDRETLVRYVDRFIMFYIRTADRLQRTAAWLEAMEGGIDHLRRVVVDDALGIGAELEAEVAAHVSRYRCEWAETLEDPLRIRRFRTFVNSELPDPDIVVVKERSQPRPARPWERVEARR